MTNSLNANNISVKDETSTKKQRDSNLELFRIITMILIVAHHYVVNSGLTAVDGPIYSNPLSVHSIFLLIFGAWGKIGINCFVLISGYFMCKSNITVKKFVKLFCEVMFYRLLINIIFWISGYSTLTLKELVKVVIPITDISTGFTSAYIVFFLFIPFLNILVKNVNEKQHIRLLLLCSFTYIFLGTFPYFSVTMNYVSWFMVLYFIASYIRFYPKKIYTNTKFWGIMTILLVLISIISVIFCAWLGLKIDKNMAYYFVTDSNTLLAVLTGLCAFMFFKNVKIRYNKFINTVAASTFGVFLIHANSDTMRQWLWNDIFNNVGMYDSSLIYIHAIVVVLVVFCICICIDYVRIKFIEAPFFRFWDKHGDAFITKYQTKLGKILKKIN